MLHSHSNLGKFWLLRYTLAGTCQFSGFVLFILPGVSWYYVMVFARSPLITNWGFPDGTQIRNPLPKQEMQETWVRFLDWEDPLE